MFCLICLILCWKCLGSFETILGVFWDMFGTCLEMFEYFLDLFAKFWDHLWDDLGGKMKAHQSVVYHLNNSSVPETYFD